MEVINNWMRIGKSVTRALQRVKAANNQDPIFILGLTQIVTRQETCQVFET